MCGTSGVRGSFFHSYKLPPPYRRAAEIVLIFWHNIIMTVRNVSHSFLLLPLLTSIKIVVLLDECLIWARHCPRYLCALSSLIHQTPCEIRFGIFILVVRKQAQKGC